MKAFDSATLERVYRSVGLAQQSGALRSPHGPRDTFVATAPPTGGAAPPGWYLLFVVVDPDGTPSVGNWVQLR
jgi:hypothetical protein